MTDDELTELELAILAACEDAKADGWRIVPHLTVDSLTRQCCPIAALGGPENPYPADEARRKTGLHPVHVTAFVDAFDGHGNSRSSFAAMGRRFRDRLESGEL
jgi:hypothetical protein